MYDLYEFGIVTKDSFCIFTVGHVIITGVKHYDLRPVREDNPFYIVIYI